MMATGPCGGRTMRRWQKVVADERGVAIVMAVMVLLTLTGLRLVWERNRG